MKRDKTAPKILSDNTFPVVGIGASAGGLNAFKKLLAAIPERSGMAYVLVQHLDPNHESALPELLQKVTSIPVSEITDDMKVLPDHIYIIPRNKMVVANDGVLQLMPRPDKSQAGLNLPIDLFFTSLAEVHQAHAIGVVLSGTASDGTAGLKAIKDYGGITFAQDEASAEFNGMPQSAALAGVVDFVLPPEEIIAMLIGLRQQIVRSDEELQNVTRQEEDVYKKILLLLHLRKGTDFTYYKQTTIRRRILRRMAINKAEEPSDYLIYLKQHKEEQDALYQDLLIPVTDFFRDPKVFEAICGTVFPAILENKAPADPIRIWVAACSTGQEAYSMAICLIEYLGDRQEKVQIFATDISEPAIAKARRGIYSKSEVANVSPERLKAFFSETGNRYRLNKQVRDMCIFAAHNFLKDPPFGKMDFVSCRNVLIYLEPYLQKRALTTFHYALNQKSFLLLGKSETISSVPEHFATVGKTDKLFTRKDVPGKFMHVANNNEQNLRDIKAIPRSENMQTDFQKTADEIILSQYTPAGVVINEAMDIVHFRGNTDAYFSHSPGKPTHNLLKMARSGLAFELRNIIHKAKKEGLPTTKDAVPMQVGDSQRIIRIDAIPLPNVLEPHYLILFHETPIIISENAGTDSATGSRKTDAERRVKQLEGELAQAREDMYSISEDQEAVNEELQSANEELLSSSEEMQSLNEELETSKEELQSSNEELTVLNQELSSLNELAITARNYAESVVATIHHPLLILDKHLRVKSANDAFYDTFSVTKQETEGVLIYDLGNRQWNIPELRTLLEEILPEKSTITDFEVTHKFASIGERIMILSALEIKREEIDEHLILLTIQDITDRKKAVEQLRTSEAEYRQIADTIPAKITNADAAGNVYYYNKAWVDYTGLSFAELKNNGWAKAMHPDELQNINTRWQDSIANGTDFEIELLLLNKAGSYRWHLSRAVPIKDDTGKVIKWIGAVTEIHTQKEQKQELEEAVKKRTAELLEASASLQQKNEELKKMNLELESFTYVSSHDLQEPLRKIRMFAALIRDREHSALSDAGKEYFQRIENATARMQALIQDLLAFSRATKADNTFEKTDLNKIIAEVMDDLADIILEKGATIHIHGSCEASINTFQFRQVIQNLFTNALKFTKAGTPPYITISCEVAQAAYLAERNSALPSDTLSPHHKYCHIVFEDNGIGFKHEYSEKIFEVFQRLNTKEQYSGTGIGLSIVKKIVDQHNGTVTASGELGKGAIFNIYIPTI